MPLWTLFLSACATRAVEGPPSATADVPPIDVLAAIQETPFAAQRPADQAADPLRPAVDGAMSVALGDLHADRDVELSGIRAEVERNAGHVQRCWEARVADLPVQEGVVTIHAQIDSSGAVIEQCLTEDAFQDPGLRRCVNDLIAMGRYPAGSPADVTFPLLFSAPKG